MNSLNRITALLVILKNWVYLELYLFLKKVIEECRGFSPVVEPKSLGIMVIIINAVGQLKTILRV